jgi:predicted nucleic acid-binding protein
LSVVVDSSILIDHLRGSVAAGAYLAGLEAPPLCSELSRIEVLQGLRSAERRAADRLFALVRWVPVDEPVSRRAGELGRRWCRSHPGLGIADLAIAATAQQLDTPLATGNVKHFPMFKGLQAPY